MFILKVENTEKAGHDVKPRLPGCAESACHRSNKTVKKKKLYTVPRTSISEYNKAFRASWCVHSAHGVCVLQNTLVCLFVCLWTQKRAV